MRELFQIMRRREGDRMVQVRRLFCAQCDAHHDITAGTLNVEQVAKRFRALGWDVDFRHIQAAICPTCSAKKAMKEKTRMATTPAPAAPENPADRAPTPDQRAAIRRLLDTHFDDKVGGYLDGYSDQRIGKDLSIPWSWVQQLREAAYGPIRIDPAVAEAQARLAALEAGLEAMAKAQQEQIDRARAEIAAMRTVVGGLSARRGA